MKINYLKLSNIGPYVGEHIFDLNANSQQNIILIGGKNGAGKTTFLKSIKYGLFGSFSLGLKTDTAKYFEEIRSLINNKSKKNFYIEISFDFIENFEVKNYILNRRWMVVENRIDEKIVMKKDNYVLDDYETKELLDKLKAITSPQLINSFIFDGEKIASIIEDEKIADYLEETFNCIFNIDMLDQTMRDIDFYMSKKAEENDVKEQMDNVSIISSINSLKKQIKLQETELLELKTKLNNLLVIKKSNLDNYYKLGGLNKIQQQKMEKDISSFIKEREVMNSKIKSYIENDLPIYMNKELLQDAILQSNGERQSQFPKIFKEIENYLGVAYPDIEKLLLEKTVSCKCIHNLTEQESSFLEDKFTDVHHSTAIIKPFLDNKHIKVDEYKLMKNKLANSENIEKIKELLDENLRIDSSIAELNNSISELESKISFLHEDLTVKYGLYEKVNEELKKSSLYDSSFNLANLIRNLTENYKNQLLKLKLKRVSKMALKIFNDTIRKTDFFSELTISNDFDLKLKNSLGVKVNPKILSAGEMQILVSSLIWAMFKVSGRREMFIFDTPLARLDNENRYNFITKIISTISSQVIILSTDSEFIEGNLKAIEDIIYKKYILDYDVQTGLTNVREGYFNS